MSGVLMSFVPATPSRDFLALLAVAVVAVLALFLRRGSATPPASGITGSPLPPGPDVGDSVVVAGGEDDEEADGESVDELAQVPVSSEGVAFIPRSYGVLLLPMAGQAELPDWVDHAVHSNFVPFKLLNDLVFSGSGGDVPAAGYRDTLSTGDLTGARVVPGSPGAEAWRLETLGRDGDFAFFPFSAREAAEVALEMLVKHGIVHRPENEEHQVVPASAEDFEEARRRFEETESELANDRDDDPPPREGQWVSDRR